ncbi:MAG TPA: YraN family protein, partial [Candidatus Dormibacteraeota bacterium]|nr:YraN family protein [Candidatus Dormibacteraeota bacterium]
MDRPANIDAPRTCRRTPAQQAGDAAETVVAGALTGAGWTVLARNVRVGRGELDLLAIDPGPPERLVAVEVRWRRPAGFGQPEETVDRQKRRHLRAAVGRLLAERRLPDGRVLPRLPPSIDLVVVEPSPYGPQAVRHLR